MKRDVPDLLERRLQEEAKALRDKDGFSLLLHQRIMASLRQRGLAGTPLRDERTWTIWRIAGLSAAAAAVLLVSALIVFRFASTQPQPGPPIAGSGNPKSPGPVAARPTVDPASSALEERKYAYLDRDAHHLFTFVANQLPTFPTAKPAPNR